MEDGLIYEATEKATKETYINLYVGRVLTYNEKCKKKIKLQIQDWTDSTASDHFILVGDQCPKLEGKV